MVSRLCFRPNVTELVASMIWSAHFRRRREPFTLVCVGEVEGEVEAALLRELRAASGGGGTAMAFADEFPAPGPGVTVYTAPMRLVTDKISAPLPGRVYVNPSRGPGRLLHQWGNRARLYSGAPTAAEFASESSLSPTEREAIMRRAFAIIAAPPPPPPPALQRAG